MLHAVGIYFQFHLALSNNHQQSSGAHVCNLGNVPKTHPTYKRTILKLGVKLKWKNLQTSEINFKEILHEGVSSHLGSRDFTQSLNSLIQYSVSHLNNPSLESPFLGSITVVDRVDSYQTAGQTTQN